MKSTQSKSSHEDEDLEARRKPKPRGSVKVLLKEGLTMARSNTAAKWKAIEYLENYSKLTNQDQKDKNVQKAIQELLKIL